MDLTLVHALVAGPSETPYEGGFFYFVLGLPHDYPNAPPKVRMMTTGGGKVRFNPNLYKDGKVCLSILGTWPGPGWSPAQSLSSVLLSIQSLMCERPYHNEPGFEVARNPHDSKNYNDCIRHETLRVAVCEMLEENSASAAVPEELRVLMRSLFPTFCDSYLASCRANTTLNGQTMLDPFGERRGNFRYDHLQTRLEALQLKVCSEEEKDDDEDDDDEEAVEGAAASAASAGGAPAGAAASGSPP